MPESQVFVDTTAWYALLDRRDARHVAAKRFQLTNRRPLLTSNFVFDELLTLTKVCLGSAAAIRVGKQLYTQQIAQLFPVTREVEDEAWRIFQQYSDKGFSFTDCASFALMERMGIDTVFAFDIHFRQYGRFTVVPQDL